MNKNMKNTDKKAPDFKAICPAPIMRHQTIQLAHGSGGRLMNNLIRDLFLEALHPGGPAEMEDCADLQLRGRRVSFSTDTFVVDPIFFPGGDIGELAVNGTVNDIAMGGAVPKFLSAGFILEEGFPISDLQKIVISMAAASARAGVKIVTGDTKVVHKGNADKIYINTSGIGVNERGLRISSSQIREGDRVLVSGTLGDHGIAIISVREGLSFETPVISDTAPLNGLIETILDAGGAGVHAMRDPTRGGLASTLNEFAESAGIGVELNEADIPINETVAGACELLGFDPLYVANEGKLVAVVSPESAAGVLEAMRGHELGTHAADIGCVSSQARGQVIMKTELGSFRMVDMPAGEQLPRIC